MKDRAALDNTSKTVLAHLEAYVSGDEPSDPQIISDYIHFVEADKSVINGLSEILENPILTSFVPLLTRILNLDLYGDIYAELLRALLEQLRFADLLKFFPPENVVEALKLPANAVVFMAIHILKLGVARNDEDVFQFLLESDALQVMVKRVLTEPNLPTNIVLDTEETCRVFFGNESFSFDSWTFLAGIDKSFLVADATLLARYLSLVEMLNFEKIPSSSCQSIVDFGISTALSESSTAADPFVSSILVAFYANLASKAPFSLISAQIDQIFRVFVSRRQKNETDFILDPPLNSLFASLSRISGDWQKYVTKQVEDNPVLLQFDFKSVDDVRLFCQLDLSVLSNPELFFARNFSNWSFQRSLYAQFCCLLHLVDNHDFFQILISSGKSGEEILLKLPQNLIYELLVKMSQYDYSASVLLRDFPFLILTHLMANDPGIVNPEIWQAKQDTLQNLLFYRKIDLGVWEQGFKDCFGEMLNGRKIKNEPKVEVSDQAS